MESHNKMMWSNVYMEAHPVMLWIFISIVTIVFKRWWINTICVAASERVWVNEWLMTIFPSSKKCYEHGNSTHLTWIFTLFSSIFGVSFYLRSKSSPILKQNVLSIQRSEKKLSTKSKKKNPQLDMAIPNFQSVLQEGRNNARSTSEQQLCRRHHHQHQFSLSWDKISSPATKINLVKSYQRAVTKFNLSWEWIYNMYACRRLISKLEKNPKNIQSIPFSNKSLQWFIAILQKRTKFLANKTGKWKSNLVAHHTSEEITNEIWPKHEVLLCFLARCCGTQYLCVSWISSLRVHWLRLYVATAIWWAGGGGEKKCGNI